MLIECSNVPMFKCSNVNMVKLLSERTSGVPLVIFEIAIVLEIILEATEPGVAMNSIWGGFLFLSSLVSS